MNESVTVRRTKSWHFLFTELVKRDLKKKYKGSLLGMGWSILNPLLTLFVLRLVFMRFFGRTMPHYTIYLYCGNLVFTYFNESTRVGMGSLLNNASIFTKINVPKELFLLARNVQTLINFCLSLVVFFLFCIQDRIPFTWKMLLLIYPIALLVLFNIGVSGILSALYVFFRDVQYLWSIFTMLLMYVSAVFYTIDMFPPEQQKLFLFNPLFVFILYFRKVVLYGQIPELWHHLLLLGYTLAAFGAGWLVYKKYDTQFLYYL